MLTKEQTKAVFDYYLDHLVQNELHRERKVDELCEKMFHDLIYGYDKEGSKNEQKSQA